MRLFSVLCTMWSWLKDLFSVLKPCRFSAITVIVVACFLVLVQQGQEALRGLGETKDFQKNIIELLLFTFAVPILAYATWGVARQMLRFNFTDTTSKDSSRIISLKRWIPRLLGLLVFLSVIAALLLAKSAYDHTNNHAASILQILALIQLALCIFFFIFVWKRRSILKIMPIEEQNTVKHFRDFDKDIKTQIWFLALLAFVCFVVFTLAPIRAAPHIGAATIILLAAIAWVPVGSLFVYWGSRYNFPILTLLLVFAIAFSYYNDNHEIRTINSNTPLAKKASVSDHTKHWLTTRQAEISASQNKYPVFIVAAEGGGIRAAYWTAAVLTSLQDKYPNFATHVFAISGISGGSLGAGIFNLLVKEQKEGNSFKMCRDEANKAALFSCSSNILSRDFLSPTIATMLYPDLIQRFLPIGINSFDRAKSLEGAWEASWKKSIENNRMSDSFNKLWESDTKAELPALFFNSTSVETGKRFIFSNLSVISKVEGKPEFVDAFDAQSIIKNEIPFSTAIHGSARFTYVSPAGTIQDGKSNKVWGHIVDGGYFENSGAATASEILSAALGVLNEQEFADIRNKIIPIVIMISNDPKKADHHYEIEKPSVATFMNEALSPLRTLLNTRDARGSYSQMAINKEVEIPNGQYIFVGLENGNVPLPLGWMLSISAREEIDRQLNNEMTRENGIGIKVGKYLIPN
ncbi:MAG: hypothetical protein PHD65_02420 [Gallionella sp.]|nr:hypothetical protein [Gallionella sp.]